MSVAHQPPAAIIGELVGIAAEQARNLGLDGLRQNRSRAVAQNLGQRIAKSSWLRELENISVGHGVSLLCWRRGGVEHPHDTPPYPFTPSPTFAHSSTFERHLIKARTDEGRKRAQARGVRFGRPLSMRRGWGAALQLRLSQRPLTAASE